MPWGRLKVHPGALLLLGCWTSWGPERLWMPLLLSVVLHELGHLTLLWCRGIPVQTLHLTGLGCVIQTPPLPYRIEGPCALAGPGVNLLLMVLGWRLQDGAWTLVNGCLAAFNLLPLWPLDGGRFLRAWLGSRWPLTTAQTLERVVTGTVLTLLLLGAAYATCVLHLGLTPALLAAALLVKAGSEKLVAKNPGGG